MTSISLEISMVPGHKIEEAVSALESIGLRMPLGLRAVRMGVQPNMTYVIPLEDPSGDEQARLGVLSGIARLVAVYSDPEIAATENCGFGS